MAIHLWPNPSSGVVVFFFLHSKSEKKTSSRDKMQAGIVSSSMQEETMSFAAVFGDATKKSTCKGDWGKRCRARCQAIQSDISYILDSVLLLSVCTRITHALFYTTYSAPIESCIFCITCYLIFMKSCPICPRWVVKSGLKNAFLFL